jgi:hypothetical protein
VGAKKNIKKNENNNKSKLHSGGGAKKIQKIINKKNPYDCVIKKLMKTCFCCWMQQLL